MRRTIVLNLFIGLFDRCHDESILDIFLLIVLQISSR